MRGPQELVDRQQFLQPVSAVLQGARVAREAAGIARGVDHARHLRARQLGRLRGRAGARRIEQHGVEAIELRRRQRIAEEIAALDGHPPAQPACRRFGRGNGRLVALEQRDLSWPADRQRAHAGKQIGKTRRIAGPFRDRGAHGLLGALGRLQEGPGRRLDARLAEQKKRRAAHDDGLGRRPVAPAQPRQVGAFGQRHQRLAPFQRQVEALVRPQQQVDAAVGLVHHGIGRPHRPAGSTQGRPQRLQKRAKGRPGDDADADIDDARARALVEAGKHAPALPAQHEVGAAPLAGRADQRRFEARRVDAALRQRAGDQLDLPGGVGVATPMLQGAAAADLEVRAGRRLAMARRREDFHQVGGDALAALVARLGLDGLARQGEGHEVAPPLVLGDAIAAGADLQDVERDAHRVSPASSWPAASRRPAGRPRSSPADG